MIMVTFETPHHAFETFADSAGEAVELLVQAWEKHAEESGADPDYLPEFSDDIVIKEIKPGFIFVDGERVDA